VEQPLGFPISKSAMSFACQVRSAAACLSAPGWLLVGLVVAACLLGVRD